MKKIFKYLAVSVCALQPCISTAAEVALPPKIEVYQPAAVFKPVVFEDELDEMVKSGTWGQKTTPSEKKHWVVYSDRDKNTTYSTPSTTSPMGELDFNEKVIIAQIKDGFALVYTDEKFPKWPAYSERAKAKGWVPMENLLLWESCPADNKGIYRKALLAVDFKALQQMKDLKDSNTLGGSYTNPESKTGRKKIKTDMTFYYVMKTDKKTGMKLIASQSRMDGNTSQVLYGWISPESYVPWNQRSCLEANWQPNVVAIFNTPAGKTYPINDAPTLDGGIITSYYYGVVNPDETKPTSTTRYRWNAYSPRYPILDQQTPMPNVYSITFMGPPGKPIINAPDDQTAKNMQKLIDEIERLKHINIIFVIDGTRSMKPYFAATKEAIKRGIQFFDPDKFTLRVGAVIYRDYTDGEYLTEKVPLSKPNSPQLLSFLDSAGKYGANSSPADRTIAEALYKGLEVATDPAAMGFKKNESNIIVVIGDCGNDPNDTRCLTSNQIVDRLVANNIQLISFQVESNTGLAYELFNEQMRNIVKENLTRQYQALNPNVRIRFTPLPNGYDFKSNASNEFFIGAIRRPAEEIEIVDPAMLVPLIEDNIGQFALSIQKQIDVMVNFATDVDFVLDIEADGNSQALNINKDYLANRLPKGVYDAFIASGATAAIPGYVPKKDIKGLDYWKPVAFMSSQELSTLLNRLSNLNDKATPDGDRKPYIDAVKALIRVMVPDITEKDMDKMGIDEVMRLASGLNEASDAVKGRSLKEIQDPRVVPTDEYITLISTFKTKYKRLRDIATSKDYKYAYTSANGQKFYWIPVDDLP